MVEPGNVKQEGFTERIELSESSRDPESPSILAGMSWAVRL